MGINCTCPLCRHGRGELTDREYAWYLKGCIEILSSIPKSVLAFCERDDATAEETRFEDNAYDELHGGSIVLKEMIEKMKKAGIEVDPAFLHPEQFTLPKNEVKDGSDDDCTTENCK
jgi:hypothetical protein